MLASLSWLKRYLKTTATPKEIADKLTAIGLEIEEMTDNASVLKDFIIAEIKTVENHPDSDHLHVLNVWNGTEMLQIVCGAPNVRVGMKSVLAGVGVMIPSFGKRIEKGKIRGVESQGMLCAEDEIGVGTDHTGIMDLNTDLPAGTPLTEFLKTDVLFDVNVLANRPDCFGVKGLARDLVAVGLGDWIEEPAPVVTEHFKFPVSLSVTDPACPQYVARYIKDVQNKESPAWLKELLNSVGQKPISALVDITNYLCIGECRPLHVFDADKITGSLVVRSAKEGEKIKALDDKEYTLSEGMLVIADDKGVQSIAGIMGGIETAVSMDTKNVIIESAYFDPLSIARTARKLNIISDARMRFERGVDPASTVYGCNRATELVCQLCGGQASEKMVVGQEINWQLAIDFDFNEVKRLTGMDVPYDTMIDILQNLGYIVSGGKVHVPSWRIHDTRRPADLVEEIVRIYGLDTLPSAPVRAETLRVATLKPHQKAESIVRRALAGRGLCQAITWSFMDSKLAALFGSKKVALANPIASDLDEMRPSLIPNLLSATKRNQDRGVADVALFEVGPVFFSDVPGEQKLVAGGIRAGQMTPKHWAENTRAVDVFDVKADVEAALSAMGVPLGTVYDKAPEWYHPARSGSFTLGKNCLAVFGEIHPAVLKKFGIKTPTVGFEIYMNNLPAVKSKAPKKLQTSALMPLTRDFAFVMDQEVSAEKVLSAVRSVNKDLITDVSVFDVYQGEKLPEHKKQLAIKVVIQPVEKTLTDSEIEILCTQIVNFVSKNTGAVLRSA